MKAPDSDMSELIELKEEGMKVCWPPGWSAQAAREAQRESTLSRNPPCKRARVELPEYVSNSGSTPVVASTRPIPIVQAIPLLQVPAPRAALQFGTGHDLRASGTLIWCRTCGRYGAERIQKGRGLGGECVGWERRAHSNLKLLRNGLHPREETPLPPERPYYR